MIRRKAKGQEIVAEEPETPPGKVLDLVEALQASLDARGKAKAKPRKRRRAS